MKDDDGIEVVTVAIPTNLPGRPEPRMCSRCKLFLMLPGISKRLDHRGPMSFSLPPGSRKRKPRDPNPRKLPPDKDAARRQLSLPLKKSITESPRFRKLMAEALRDEDT